MPRSKFAPVVGSTASWDVQRQCAGKVKFPSKRAAAGRARALGYEPYKCRNCGGWHIGHTRGSQ